MGSSLSLPTQTQSAVETISQWRSRPPRVLIFDSGRRETRRYMHAVDRLQQSNASGCNTILIVIALDRLIAEFRRLLQRQANRQATCISSSELESTIDPSLYEDFEVAEASNVKEVIAHLRNVAVRMNYCGRIGECVEAYMRVRRPFLQSQLPRLRFHELCGGYSPRRYVHDELKAKMELWIKVSKICVKTLFEKEKKLCDEIFENLGNGGEAKDVCFVGTVECCATRLFRFAQNLSVSRQPYDMMGAVLGVYDAFLWVLPSADALFLSQQGKGIRDICAQTLLEIETDVVRMLYDLERTILHEKFNDDVSLERGEVHRSTDVVIEQIHHLVRNKNLLARLIKSPPSLDFGDVVIPQEDFVDYNINNLSFLDQHLVLIITVLLKNLEMKSKCYQDPSLGHLFVLNNVRCILRTIEGSHELQEMLGDRFVAKLYGDLGSARTSFETATCDKFLVCLREEGLYISRCCFKSRLSKTAIKRRLIAFNDVFGNIKEFDSPWTIPDDQLREEVRRSMSAILVPAYKSFLQEFGNNPQTRFVVECSKKHSAEDLEALVQHIVCK